MANIKHFSEEKLSQLSYCYAVDAKTCTIILREETVPIPSVNIKHILIQLPGAVV